MLLEQLTPHQKEKLAECEVLRRVHLLAPAGAGKTFVGLNLMLSVLCSDEAAHVLFVARSEALCFSVAKWLVERVKARTASGKKVLKRFHVLCQPFSDGPRSMELKSDEFKMRSLPRPVVDYALTVIDEAHHLYVDDEVRSRLSKWEEASNTEGSNARLLLLSDASQSLGTVIPFPKVQTRVRLTEVVRSSEVSCERSNAKIATTLSLTAPITAARLCGTS